MGVTLDLRLIDHERIVVHGLSIVNAAIKQGNPELLRAYLAELPIDIEPSVVEYRTNRLARLREFNAPAIIIENEERLLRYANGEAYRASEFKDASFDELRQLLGTWCWPCHSFSLDKSWNELHWFLEPRVGPDDLPLFPLRPMKGDPRQSMFDKPLLGAATCPLDDLGDPIIRTLGSTESDCFGYNPPETVRLIYRALECVEPGRWTDHTVFRGALYRQVYPDMDDEEVADRVEDDLSFARDVFPVFLSAYSKASDKGFGVSCEYSL